MLHLKASNLFHLIQSAIPKKEVKESEKDDDDYDYEWYSEDWLETRARGLRQFKVLTRYLLSYSCVADTMSRLHPSCNPRYT